LHLLLSHPEELRRLRNDRTLLPGAIEEMLRAESPVQILGRRLETAVTLHDVELPAGANVLLWLGAANRDPRTFERADQFDISRAGPRHVAFGFGPHFCIGAALARVVAQEVFDRLLDEWPTIERTDEPRWRPYPIFRGLADLPVEVAW
jgi:cytochrome P450